MSNTNQARHVAYRGKRKSPRGEILSSKSDTGIERHDQTQAEIDAGLVAITEFLRVQSAFRARRDLMLVAARGLAEAKQQMPCTRDFGRWLRQSAYATLSGHECASLINIGRHEKQVTRVMKAHPGLSSAVLIWRHARQAMTKGNHRRSDGGKPAMAPNMRDRPCV